MKLLKANKDVALRSVVILNTAFYKEKINRFIDGGISKGVYVIEKNDNTLTELKSF